MVFIVVFLNEGPLEKQHLLKGYPSQIYQIKSNQIKPPTIDNIKNWHRFFSYILVKANIEFIDSYYQAIY